MNMIVNLLRPATLLALLSLGLPALSAQAAETKPATAAPAPAAKPFYDAKDTAEIISAVKAALAAIEADKKDAMAAKAGELSAAWSAKEAVLRPKDEQRWWVIDVGVSKAVAALRGRKFDPARAKTFLEQTIRQLEEPAAR
jgi:hypothetical protein